jgi:penicillin-binding protein-related factor A (putative recombinase)
MQFLEKKIENEIRLRLGQRPDTVLWRNAIGFDEVHKTRYGLCKGSSDLIGIHKGRFLAIEVKRPGAKATPQQLLFLTLVQKYGGISGIATSVEEAEAIIASID